MQNPGSRGSIRRLIADMLGFELDGLLSGQGDVSKEGKSNGRILEEIDRISRDLIREVLNYRTEGNSLPIIAKEFTENPDF